MGSSTAWLLLFFFAPIVLDQLVAPNRWRQMGFSIWLLLFLILDLLVVPTLAQACSPLDFCWTCSNTGSYINGSVYEQNLNSLLSNFSSSPTQNQANSGFYNSSLGEDSNQVNAIALCRGDLGLQACSSCLKNNTFNLLRTCSNQREAVLWAPHCMVRYSDNLIFGIEKDDPSVYIPSQNNVSNAQEYERVLNEYERVLNPVLQYLSDKAASVDSVKKYAAGHATVPGRVIYALVQCTPDLDNQNCSNCLKKAMSDIPGHNGARQGGRVLKPSCTVRYEAGLFYEATSDSIVNVSTPVTPTTPVTPPSVPSKQGKKSNKKKTIIIIIVVVIVIAFVTMLFTGICIFSRVKQQRGKLENEYDFEIIRSATGDFSDANKLGQGGFGAVYEGMLNRQHIAVKRLSKNSEQGEREFKNEVMLLAQLQHQNLVTLVGFCKKGKERLLIYEFVPKKSLNHYIFDPINHEHLDWETRYKIIGGIVRGLVYLHEDSGLRVIHCDLKLSNILLDEEMNPKIADFGKARFSVMDQTQGDTMTTIGTDGDMVPEYKNHGPFSIKSDVFSFGVIVLEMVSGKRNTGDSRHCDNTENLLSYAWRNWMHDTILKIIDTKLKTGSRKLTTGSRNEMIRCIHIGLLCVQENVNDRPTMGCVASLLSNHSLKLSAPTTPAELRLTLTDDITKPY